MRIPDLRDWHSCLESIRLRLDYSIFKSLVEGGEEEIMASAVVLSEETDREIAEGMLHAVVSLPSAEEASSQLEQFAAELAKLQPDPTAETESGLVAGAYREFCDQIALVQRGLPAVVETFKTYANGSYDTCKEAADVLKDAQSKLHVQPQAALKMVAEAGALHLRGLEEVDDLLLYNVSYSPAEPLSDWINAVANVVNSIPEDLDEFPLGEVELARDQWRAPDDLERIEYKRGKLARLGMVEPELQDLLLPLLSPQDKRPTAAEEQAIIAAGPKVVPGLIAIAGDDDSQLQASISGGEAAITAVNLLADLRAAEAVPTLLEVLKNSDALTIIHDHTLQVLQDNLPDLAFDAALEMFDQAKDVELKSDLAGILAKGGRGKPGVFERLIKFFREEKDQRGLVAVYLADFGDPRALPDLHEAARTADDWLETGNMEEAIVRLGGEPSPSEQRKAQRLRAQMLAPSRPATPPQPVPVARPSEPTPVAKPAPIRVTKIGRNEPCPCGSGKKYKKCCGR